jgi:predicted dehydrogenase
LKVKIGIIGSGLIAQLMHIPYIKDIASYDLVAICDIVPSLVEKVARKYAVPKYYVDHNKMLKKEDLDAVVVCTSSEFHDLVSIDSSEAGCHVLVEKPMALSVKAADNMVRAAEKADRILMMAYMKRYDPGYLAGAAMMKRIIDDVVLIRSHDFPNGVATMSKHTMFGVLMEAVWREENPEIQQKLMKRNIELTSQQLGEFSQMEMAAWQVLLGLGAHDMTVLRGVFGDPKAVLTSSIIPGVTSEGAEGPYATMEAMYTVKIISMLDYGKAKCTFEVGGTQRTWFDEELTAYSNKETISIKFPMPWLKHEPTVVTRKSVKDGGFDESVLTASYRESFKDEHLHFIDCIEKNKQPITVGTEGKRDLEVLYSILEKARK